MVRNGWWSRNGTTCRLTRASTLVKWLGTVIVGPQTIRTSPLIELFIFSCNTLKIGLSMNAARIYREREMRNKIQS